MRNFYSKIYCQVEKLLLMWHQTSSFGEKYRMKRWFAPALICGVVTYAAMLPLAAIAQTPKTINKVSYRCDDGKGFTAEFRDDATAKTTFGSKVIVLTQDTAASGIRYSNGSVTLVGKGPNAFVEVGDNTLFANCVETGRVSGLW
jgi:membrane-bound inhibitor of C-type lysozyme